MKNLFWTGVLLIAAGTAGIACVLAIEVFGVPSGRSHEVALPISYGFAAAFLGILLSMLTRSRTRGRLRGVASWVAAFNGLGAAAIVLSRLLTG